MDKVFAVDIGSITPGINQFATWGSLVSVILRNALVLAGVVAFVLLIVAGFQFIVGAGDAKRMEQTRTTVMIVLVGLIVVAVSVWIVQIVEKITGLNLISP